MQQEEEKIISVTFKTDFEYIHRVIDNVMYESLERDIKSMVYKLFLDHENELSDHKKINELGSKFKKLVGVYVDAYTDNCKYYRNVHNDITKHIHNKIDEILNYMCTNLKSDKNFKLDTILI